jgi:hypothetical protein
MEARVRKGRRQRRRGQGMTEMIILIALVGLVLCWVVVAFPRAITSFYRQQVQIIASPF